MRGVVTIFGDSLKVNCSGWDTFYLILIFAPFVLAPFLIVLFVAMSKKKQQPSDQQQSELQNTENQQQINPQNEAENEKKDDDWDFL